MPERLPRAVCRVVADLFSGSHETIEAQFYGAGIPGPPPSLKKELKFSQWLAEASVKPDVDILSAVGMLIEEFMDVAPVDTPHSFFGPKGEDRVVWEARRQRVIDVFREQGFIYFPGGRVMRTGQSPLTSAAGTHQPTPTDDAAVPPNVETVLKMLVSGLPRAMQPLSHRRKGVQSLSFSSEYDIQDMLHALMRPWIKDIRAEENAPSVAGIGTRMDFLLPTHRLVIEVKRVRSASHAKTIGDELILDIAHYREHPQCDRLWCVIYDADHLIQNQPGFITDIEKGSTDRLKVTVFICAP